MNRTAAFAALLTLACAHTTPPAAESVRRYDYLLGAGRAGSQVVTTRGNERSVQFEYNDRGRGPKTDSQIVLDDRWFPTSMRTTGNDYYKAAVNETFETAGGKVTWSNGAESGSSADPNALYIGMYAPAEGDGLIARALLAAKDHRLPLLPSGEASIRRIRDLTLTGGGHTQHVTLYAINGFGFTPGTIWLDDDGELFAEVSSWSSTIREGWDDSVQTLLAAEDAWRNEETKAVAKRLTHAPRGGAIAITNARIFDPVTLKTTPSMTVIVRGKTIENVGAGIEIAADAERIDARGRTLLPGLWDMHQHFGPGDGLLDIANGVTDSRDLGNDVDFITGLRKAFDAGDDVGPHIVMAALIDGPGKYTGPTKLVVDSEDDVRKVIDRVVPLGFEQTKIYSSIRPELVPFIARYSHEHGMRVSGHIPANMRAEEAVRAGYDEIQHVNFLFLNFMPDVTQTQTTARFLAVGERAAALDLNSPEVRGFIDLLREHKTVIDPTLDVFEGLFVARKGEVSPTYAAIADRLPPQVRRGFLTGGLQVPDGMDQRYRDSFAKMLAMVKALHDAGIPIVAGTDALPGFALHRELELYVQAGIPAPEVLRIATLGAATVARRADHYGSIAPGKAADLVLVDGDPTTNISDVRKVATVIKDGNIFDPREVEKEIGVLPPK
jgi:cytosine/adenosine deaminase-related metal-dependent hydrolase